eukprot:tig00021127_g18788.t1
MEEQARRIARLRKLATEPEAVRLVDLIENHNFSVNRSVEMRLLDDESESDEEEGEAQSAASSSKSEARRRPSGVPALAALEADGEGKLGHEQHVLGATLKRDLGARIKRLAQKDFDARAAEMVQRMLGERAERPPLLSARQELQTRAQWRMPRERAGEEGRPGRIFVAGKGYVVLEGEAGVQRDPSERPAELPGAASFREPKRGAAARAAAEAEEEARRAAAAYRAAHPRNEYDLLKLDAYASGKASGGTRRCAPAPSRPVSQRRGRPPRARMRRALLTARWQRMRGGPEPAAPAAASWKDSPRLPPAARHTYRKYLSALNAGDDDDDDSDLDLPGRPGQKEEEEEEGGRAGRGRSRARGRVSSSSSRRCS